MGATVAGSPSGTAVGGATWGAGAPLGSDFMPPGAPAGLSATGGANSIGLSGRRIRRPTSRVTASIARRARPVPTTGTPLSGANLLSATTYVDTTATASTTYYYVVVAVDFSNNQSLASTSASAVAGGSGSNQAVQLNGTSQYLTFGAAPALNASNFTLELWFRRTGVGAGTSTGTGGIASAIPLITKGRAEVETPANLNMDYFLGIDASTGTLVADFEDNANGTNHPVTGTTAVTSNVWHHAAAVYNTSTDTWQLYLDGALDRTLALGGDFTPESTSIQHAADRQRAHQQRHRRRLLPGRRRRGPDLERPAYRRADPGVPGSGTQLGNRPDRPLRPERGRRRDRRLQRGGRTLGESRGRPALDRRGAAHRRRQRHERPAVGDAHGARPMPPRARAPRSRSRPRPTTRTRDP